MGGSEVRLSDDDRQAIIDALRQHCADGRLTLDEFAERAGVVYGARTRAELGDVLDDLPPPAPPSPIRAAPAAVAAPAAAPGQPAVAKQKRRRIVAIMSGAKRRGRWKVDRPITAFAFWGGVVIDLRDAQIEVPVVDIRAWSIMGGIDIKVPEGIPVEVDGFILMGAHEDRVANVPEIPGAPPVRVHCYGMWGSVSVRSRKVGERNLGEEIAERVRENVERGLGSHKHHRHRPAPLPMPRLDDLIPRMPDLAEPLRRGARYAGPRGRGLIESVAAAESAATEIPATELPRGTVTILFTDISGSTELALELGDQGWLRVLQDHNELVRERVRQHGGTEVKVHGDGFMVVFPSARSALLCAIDIQRAMTEYSARHPDTPVQVRIGLHTGEVVEQDGDYFGRNVILAARIAGHAEGGEILASGLVKELTDSAGDLGFDDGRDVELKGMSRLWRVHRVEWA